MIETVTRKARVCTLAFGLLFPLASAADAASIQATYYVSPSGSDDNAGTEAMPFRTITKARDVVRTVNTTMSGDIVVYLRGGTYSLDAPLSFGPSDGGREGFYVRYANYPGETPLLTGGRPVAGWTLHDQAKNIWKASGVTWRFRQMYVNGAKAIRARYPNLGSDGSHDFFRLTKVDTTGRAFDVSSSYVSNWNQFSKVEMHLMIAWADATLRLASSTNMGSTTKLQIQDPERTMLFNRPYPMLGIAFWSKDKQQAFYFENAYEFLDQPGEWYLDESTNTVYYLAKPGESMAGAKVVAPVLENLVSVTGPTTSTTVGYLAFQGLDFAHTNFLRPSERGFLNLQAGQFNVAAPGGNNYMLWRPNAGVTVTNAHHIRFERNLFAHMAASGLDFISGTHDDAIVGNVFTDLGGTGITLGKFAQDSLTEIHIPYNPSDRSEISTRDTVKNNLVTNVTTEIQGAIGIAAGYPRDLVIEHNEVSYTNYSGISVGFGWTKEPTAMSNNHINWNEIHHVERLLSDAGEIYTLSNQGTGGQIQYNYMHDITASPWTDYWINPIYLDEGSSEFDVSHNVFSNAPGGIACNSCGTYTKSDNEGSSASTISGAGIEAAFRDIRNNLSVPVAVFTADSGSTRVENGDFERGTSPWTFNVWEGGAKGSIVDGEYAIRIDSIGQHNSSIQLVQNGIFLEQGKTYKVSFDAYATAGRTLEANVEMDASPWTSYLPELQSFDLTTSKSTFSYSFVMTHPTDANGRIAFNAGASTESVFLDNVSIERAASSSIRPEGVRVRRGLRWSNGLLLVPGRASGTLQIIDARGVGRIYEVTHGKAAVGPMATGLYRVRWLDGTPGEVRKIMVIR